MAEEITTDTTSTTTSTTTTWWKRKTVIVGAVTFGGVVIAELCGVTITTDTLSAVGDILYTFVSAL
ncbi:MAG: hypothetical protein R3Y11_01840 [Pseudomonadota bacterium]